ncbi:MAG TPA: magnesium transporter [Candidatus Paceibacterota bacterium]|nr:magnesium transporter [Candidatus Paceibacterota bacterium]HRZ91485.1 magnesium transporter [Candidatus Paceibacterota bacterium]
MTLSSDMQSSVSHDEYLNWHAADLADHLQRLSNEEARALLRALPPEKAGAALAEVEPDKVRELVSDLAPGALAGLLRHAAAPKAADIVQELAPAMRRDTLAALPPEHASSIRALLRYPEDTAGGIMSNRFIALHEGTTVEEVRQLLRSRAEQERTEDVAYLYVTDGAQRLVGIVSLRDLVFRRAERRMGEIMNRDVKSVRAEIDQEELARQFEHYHYLGLPVLDAEGRLVGVVKASDALAIARKEATEDMQLMVGLSGEERALTPWRKSIGRRLPWLCVNLSTAFAAAAVVNLFEGTIARWTALAVFLPIIAGQGGNAGMQTLTVIIRDLALGEISPGEGRKALLKEITLGLVNGLAIGLIVGLIGWAWKGSALLGLVAGAAMLLNQLAAALSGVVIPLGLKLLRVDPALASSIFLTTVTDVGGFFFFLGLAAIALHLAPPL